MKRLYASLLLLALSFLTGVSTARAGAPPIITSSPTATGMVGTPFSYQITAVNDPTSFGSPNLPPGLTVDTGTGLISGTPTTAGVYNSTITATNAFGTGSAMLDTSISAVGAPVITSPSSASGTVGVPFSYQITATNHPTSFGAAPLCVGLNVNTTTGLISGTPTSPCTIGTEISATNSSGTGYNTVWMSILNSNAPVITSPSSASGTVGSSFTYTITATNHPTSFGANGLPPGLSVNTQSGVISGTPTTDGVFIPTISAYNSSGVGSELVTMTIAALQAPAITSPGAAQGVVGSSFTYQITATNNPTSFGASPLPQGLSINTGTGLISGTPTTAGVTTVTLSATNAAGTGTAPMVLTLAAQGQALPVITSPSAIEGFMGSAFFYQITATNNPASFNAAPLPPGLTVNTLTGLISGTPTSISASSVTLNAFNNAGAGTAGLSLVITSSPTLTLPPTLPINGQISLDYSNPNLPYFNWMFAFQGNSLQGSSIAGNQNIIPRDGTESYTTSSPQLNLTTLPLVAGTYLLTVRAVDSDGNGAVIAQGLVTLVSSNLSAARVFPNPWRSDKHTGSPITFDQLTGNATVKIFTISGHFVRSLSTNNGSVTWDMTNDSGDKVASGFYYYLITNDQGQKSKGELAIIK